MRIDLNGKTALVTGASRGIGEAIARLPGLAAQRTFSGRASYISVRGFSPDFTTTLLNGREQTSTGDNRAVEYDQYPSEIVNQVNIYKTPISSVVGQGLAATGHDVQRRKPDRVCGDTRTGEQLRHQ